MFRGIVEKLTKNIEDKKRKGLDTEKRPLFDIVAGTSIGGMNAAIVVSTIIKKNEGKSLEDPENWKDSAEKVIKFWNTKNSCLLMLIFLIRIHSTITLGILCITQAKHSRIHLPS